MDGREGAVSEVTEPWQSQVGQHSWITNMQCVLLFCLLAVAAAVPLAEEPGASAASEAGYPDVVREALAKALQERPKKVRQLFHEDLPKREERIRKLKKARSEEDKEAGPVKEEKQEEKRENADPDQEQGTGWQPMNSALTSRQLARSLSLSESDDPATDSSEASNDTSSETEDLDLEENEVEDRKAANSYLSPLYAPAPGGLAGGYGGYGGGYGGYGGQGPYIYILPIVLPPPGRHHGPAARHVVTETGHESHHYSGGHAGLPPGGHGQYQPVYAGSHGVPPIYIPKGYGGVHGGHGIHGGYGGHGKHGGHTTVHHEEAAIIRDIDPPIFKA